MPHSRPGILTTEQNANAMSSKSRPYWDAGLLGQTEIIGVGLAEARVMQRDRLGGVKGCAELGIRAFSLRAWDLIWVLPSFLVPVV